jgi:hypothetical protein
MHRTRAAVFVATLTLGAVAGSAAASADFGAIAYAPKNGAYGFAYGFDSRNGAERKALRECAARGKGCQVVVWFTNACGSLAVGKKGGYASAWGDNRATARATAIRECRKRDSGCSELVWSCSG